MHIALLAADKSGCIVVDSTRRGKQYPDSFYATVPLWCGVINAIVFGDSTGTVSLSSQFEKIDNDEINVVNFVGPPWMPKSQRFSIQSVISNVIMQMPMYLKDYIRNKLSQRLLKPLQPLWVSPVDGMLDVQGDDAACESLFSSSSSSACSFVPIILLSVSEERSEKQHRAEGFSWFYVKGAGDDQENWCRGLSPSDFWSHKEDLLLSDDPDCVDEVADEVVDMTERSLPATLRFLNKCKYLCLSFFWEHFFIQ